MRDMKVGFNLTNPTVTGVDWSFVPKISEETAAKEGLAPQRPDEGEVIGGIHVVENVVVLDEPEVGGDQRSLPFWLDWVNSEFSKSNLGRGTYSVVRGPPELGGLQSQIVGPTRAPLLVGVGSWDLTSWSGD
ncbi:hypothetical protein TIFTF001_021621 [Ficus carica]|uniref:Uncharacterized protein n=1 Tax=Ficus carica TaxID=3494 RepID=A0AA88DAX9_FICCA|nr:hypothetical protein TIFTF001_021621 [Ficus carica]